MSNNIKSGHVEEVQKYFLLNYKRLEYLHINQISIKTRMSARELIYWIIMNSHIHKTLKIVQCLEFQQSHQRLRWSCTKSHAGHGNSSEMIYSKLRMWKPWGCLAQQNVGLMYYVMIISLDELKSIYTVYIKHVHRYPVTWPIG